LGNWGVCLNSMDQETSIVQNIHAQSRLARQKIKEETASFPDANWIDKLYDPNLLLYWGYIQQ
jgi:hypothetical protein